MASLVPIPLQNPSCISNVSTWHFLYILVCLIFRDRNKGGKKPFSGNYFWCINAIEKIYYDTDWARSSSSFKTSHFHSSGPTALPDFEVLMAYSTSSFVISGAFSYTVMSYVDVIYCCYSLPLQFSSLSPHRWFPRPPFPDLPIQTSFAILILLLIVFCVSFYLVLYLPSFFHQWQNFLCYPFLPSSVLLLSMLFCCVVIIVSLILIHFAYSSRSPKLSSCSLWNLLITLLVTAVRTSGCWIFKLVVLY